MTLIMTIYDVIEPVFSTFLICDFVIFVEGNVRINLFVDPLDAVALVNIFTNLKQIKFIIEEF